MQVILYCNLSDKKTKDKIKTQLTQPISASPKGDIDILHPEILLTYDPAYITGNVNYCYIADYGRYYFVNTPTLLTGGEMLLSCEIDVLSTWAQYVNNIATLIERQEFVNSPLVSDKKYILRNDRYIDRYVIGSALTEQGYYLTVNGGTEKNE